MREEKQAQLDYVPRMRARIKSMVATSREPLESTEDLFTATGKLRSKIEDQRADAQALASVLEDGTSDEEYAAEQLFDYAEALTEALDTRYPAPHYQAVISGLQQRLDPDQVNAIRESNAMENCSNATLEMALYSGNDLLTGKPMPSHENSLPSQYLHHKRAWDEQCSVRSNYLTGTETDSLTSPQRVEHFGYTAMAPLKEAVREVMTDAQRIEHDQGQIAASAARHLPDSHQQRLNELAHYYALPLTQTATPETTTVLPHQAIDSPRVKAASPDLN